MKPCSNKKDRTIQPGENPATIIILEIISEQEYRKILYRKLIDRALRRCRARKPTAADIVPLGHSYGRRGDPTPTEHSIETISLCSNVFLLDNAPKN